AILLLVAPALVVLIAAFNDTPTIRFPPPAYSVRPFLALADADDLIEEGPVSFVRDLALVALHTPGHTEGSTCFYLPAEGILFSGDVLFSGNVGRVDLPGGDPRQMEASLRRVAALPPRTRVYPGHGPPTTIGDELGWLRGALQSGRLFRGD
ncbi:MAG: MBL fold metallo-hydrolase, partial [Chloroflexi bacterium]|nr:MBL fold metallo-hydrolase [Chloroflexota bacterium]